MSVIKEDIERALIELNIDPSLDLKCDEATAAEVIQRVEATFIEGNPSVWWFALKHAVSRKHFSEGGFLHLGEYLPDPDLECWFIPETPPRSYSIVYRLNVSQIQKVLGDCVGFVYYLVDTHFTWLLVENDSDQFILCKLPESASACTSILQQSQ